jgi:hypothetical protein
MNSKLYTSIFRHRQEIFLSSTALTIRPALGFTNGYQRALSPGVKRPGREFDHSPPSRAEVKKNEGMPPLPMHIHGEVLH